MSDDRPHVRGLDGVRGLAIALVFAHHVVVRDRAPAILGGWVGVDLFFVLSGFLITTSMLQRAELGGFLERRFWRIAPAMAVLLAIYAAWSVTAGDTHQRLVWAFAAATQWANVQGAIGPPFSPHIGHLWSLSNEVQFYVLWGVALWAMLRARVPRVVVFGVIVTLFVGGAIERAVLWDDGAIWNRLYLGPDTRSAGLMVGCGLGLAHAWGWLRWRRTVGALVLPAVVFIAWFVAELSFLDGRTYTWALTCVVLAMGVVVASGALGLATPLRPVIELRPLAWLGEISYSVYLWHLPVIAEVAAHRPDDPLGVAVVALPLTLAVSWVSYVVIERPLMSSAGRARLRRRLG